MSTTWVVIPVYNEAPAIEGVLEDVTALFGHVVCVDDASTDGSAAIISSVPGVRLVRHPINLGQGAALQTGIEYALQDPAMTGVVTFDADGQHHASDAARLARRLGLPGPDGRPLQAVLGTRWAEGREAKRPGGAGPARRLLLRAAVVYTRATVGLRVTDTHNGLRALSREVAASLHLKQNGMAHASEILQRIKAGRFCWAEEPVTIDYTEYSKSKGQSPLNAINILTELWLGRR
ncbi:MAG: glycosyltransferase family 2 protein [Bifidobacteriaceae bacterium]|nr:glycosyltransferase family 2 protein [Bifidobacteriaceae bacterium]